MHLLLYDNMFFVFDNPEFKSFYFFLCARDHLNSRVWFNVKKGMILMKLRAWLQASRLPAQLFIFPALLLGQGLYAFGGDYTLSIATFIIVHLYGVFMHLFIVYANDYADFETDTINLTFTPFTGGSRVLVEGALKKADLKKGAFLMAFLSIATGIYLSALVGSALPLIVILIGILLMFAYSFGPIKLSYRGYGESLQAIGVGVVLPVVGFLAHGGTFDAIPWGIVIAFVPAQYAMAIGTALPDEPSDRLTDKRTTPVNIGINGARQVMIGLFVLSLGLVVLQSPFSLLINASIGGIVATLIGAQLLLHFLKPLPGSAHMLQLVGLSIVTNTTLTLGIALSSLLA